MCDLIIRHAFFASELRQGMHPSLCTENARTPPHRLYSPQCPFIKGTWTVSSSMEQETMHAETGIAIIGMGCRLPGDAGSLEGFWELLIQGRSSWSKIPADRWNANAYYHPSGERKGTVSWRALEYLLPVLTESRRALKAVTFSIATSRTLIPHFSPSPLMKPKPWILSNVCYWR